MIWLNISNSSLWNHLRTRRLHPVGLRRSEGPRQYDAFGRHRSRNLPSTIAECGAWSGKRTRGRARVMIGALSPREMRGGDDDRGSRTGASEVSDFQSIANQDSGGEGGIRTLGPPQ